MMIFAGSLFALLSICNAKPCTETWPPNVLYAVPSCPPGWQWVGGYCRNGGFNHWGDRNNVEDHQFDVATRNIISVPSNCKPGQEWVNGACRDVWRYLEDMKTQRYTNNMEFSQLDNIDREAEARITGVPDLICPDGYKFDALHKCRKREQNQN